MNALETLMNAKVITRDTVEPVPRPAKLHKCYTCDQEFKRSELKSRNKMMYCEPCVDEYDRAHDSFPRCSCGGGWDVVEWMDDLKRVQVVCDECNKTELALDVFDIPTLKVIYAPVDRR